MNIAKIPLLLFIILALITGCGEDPAKPTSAANQLWPLAEGYYWCYYVYLQYKGEKYQIIGYSDRKVKKQVKIGSEYWYVMGNMFSEDTDVMMTNKKDGLWEDYYYGSAASTPAKCLLYKYPTFKGDIHIFDGDTIETTSTTASVKTLCGIFSCTAYSTKGNYTTIFYFTPGIGPVKAMQVAGFIKENGVDIAVWKVMELYDYWVK